MYVFNEKHVVHLFICRLTKVHHLPAYSDHVASHARSHVQFQLLVPSSTVVSDLSDWNKPSGSVVSEFSRKSNVSSWSRPLNVSAVRLEIPEDRRSTDSSSVRLENSPAGRSVSRKSALKEVPIVIYMKMLH